MNVVSMVQSTCLRDLSLRKYSRSSGASGRNTRRQSFAAAAALKTTTGSCWTCAPDFVLDQNKLTLVQRLSRGLCTSTLALALALAPVPTTDSSVQALGPVKVELSDVHIEKLECEGMAGPGGAASPDDDTGTGCYKVTAQATNPGKELFNADVFGFIYDQYDNPALDVTENIRISYIGKIEPGKSTVNFRLVLPNTSAPAETLKLKGLKASGFAGRMLPGQGSGVVTDCDEFTPPEECESIPF